MVHKSKLAAIRYAVVGIVSIIVRDEKRAFTAANRNSVDSIVMLFGNNLYCVNHTCVLS